MKTRLTLPVVSAAFFAGALFAVGLILGGMTHPSKIFSFLDFTGDWDPSLMFVMVGAIGVNAPLTHWIRQRKTPLLQPAFAIPSSTGPWRSQINAPLVVGAALFGVGWGLGGYCPGPALVSLPSVSADDAASGVVFTGAMLAGMALFTAYDRFRQHKVRPQGQACCEPVEKPGTLSAADGIQSPAVR